jgi:hypothetical protein
MKQSWAYKNLLTRKFVAVVVLCLFVMKGLSFIGLTASVASDPSSNQQIAATFLLGEICKNNQNGNDHSEGHIDHSQCCVFCSSTIKDTVIIDVASLEVVAVLSPVEEAKPVLFMEELVKVLDPLGFANNWSSTSPPRA